MHEFLCCSNSFVNLSVMKEGKLLWRYMMRKNRLYTIGYDLSNDLV